MTAENPGPYPEDDQPEDNNRREESDGDNGEPMDYSLEEILRDFSRERQGRLPANWSMTQLQSIYDAYIQKQQELKARQRMGVEAEAPFESFRMFLDELLDKEHLSLALKIKVIINSTLSGLGCICNIGHSRLLDKTFEVNIPTIYRTNNAVFAEIQHADQSRRLTIKTTPDLGYDPEQPMVISPQVASGLGIVGEAEIDLIKLSIDPQAVNFKDVKF